MEKSKTSNHYSRAKVAASIESIMLRMVRSKSAASGKKSGVPFRKALQPLERRKRNGYIGYI